MGCGRAAFTTHRHASSSLGKKVSVEPSILMTNRIRPGELKTRTIKLRGEANVVSQAVQQLLGREVSDEFPADEFDLVNTGPDCIINQISAGLDHVLAVTSTGALLGGDSLVRSRVFVSKTT